MICCRSADISLGGTALLRAESTKYCYATKHGEHILLKLILSDKTPLLHIQVCTYILQNILTHKIISILQKMQISSDVAVFSLKCIWNYAYASQKEKERQ